MDYIMGIVLTMALYAIGVLLAFAAGVPDALSSPAQCVLYVSWSIVAAVIAAAWVGRLRS